MLSFAKIFFSSLLFLQANTGSINLSSATIAQPGSTLIINGDSNVCLPVSNLIYTASPNSSSPVTWKLSDSSLFQSINILNDSSISLIPANNISQPDSVTLYALEGTCCTLIDSLTIHIYPQHQKLPDSLLICNGGRLQPGSWFKNYLWQDGSTDSFHIVINPGLYTVSLTDFCGNNIKDSSLVLRENPAAVQHLSCCQNDTLILKLPAQLNNYVWIPNVDLKTLSDSVVEIFPSASTTYYGSAITPSGCLYSDTCIVTVYPAPIINLGNDTSICGITNIMLNAGSGFSKYLWSTGDSGSTYNVTIPGTYSVKVYTSEGCYASDTIVISHGVCQPNAINVPSAFTPNNDGINDNFKPIITGYLQRYEFEIYNRWGQIVFRSASAGAGWDGTLNGTKLNSGTYVWKCDYQFINDVAKTIKGFVVLIR